MAEDIIRRGAERLGRRLDWILLAIVGLLLVCAVLAQPGWSLLAGFWQIQISETGLITDPVATGSLGGALLNAALVLLLSILLVRWMRLPVTGAAFACLFLMAGFAMLGKNLLNIAPIVAGGWLHALYKRESFAKYVYLTLYGTCLSPMVSFLMVHTRPGFRWLAMALCGLAIGFLLPAIARFTTRVHQGYNLYNVGFAAGILGLGIASVFKGFGVEFVSVGSWSQSGHGLLCGMMVVLLSGLFACGVLLGCRSPGAYRRVLRHSGRAVADFIILDGPGIALVNMALVGSVGLAYLLMLYGQGVRLNGPLVCCLFAMTGFGAFGKHPRNILPVMGGRGSGGAADGQGAHHLPRRAAGHPAVYVPGAHRGAVRRVLGGGGRLSAHDHCPEHQHPPRGDESIQQRLCRGTGLHPDGAHYRGGEAGAG